jgi:redox-sensitive bicupin YhaK (pirin superfamily)
MLILCTSWLGLRPDGTWEAAMSKVKRFTRIVADAAGGSTFQDDEFLLDAAPDGADTLTGTVPDASAVVYVRHDAWGNFAHPAPRPAPRRQWVVVLRGAVEVEVTDGSRRTFGPGDLLRAEDTEGAGHVTSPVGDPPLEALFLPG